MSSTRLPKKILLPYAGESILTILIDRLRSLHLPLTIATTTNPADDILEQYCLEHKVRFIRGSEEDVLSRYLLASEDIQTDYLIRVCSDNPFLDVALLSALIDELDNDDIDYLSYSINGHPVILTHYGFFAEIVKLSTLRDLHALGNPACREHVTNCIYTQEDKYNIKWVELSSEIFKDQVRLTIDTPEDFKVTERIYLDLVKTNSLDHQSVLNYIYDRDYLLKEMRKQILQNSKS